MTIQFNNIPDTIRTPGAFVEIDNSRALTGLVQNPHKVLMIGQRIIAGSVQPEILITMTRDGLADDFFGPGSQLARMCNAFKGNNPNTELHAVALSDNGTTKASGAIQFSIALSATGFSLSGSETYHLLVNGKKLDIALTSGWSTTDVNSAVETTIDADSTLPVVASTNATSALVLIAVNAGTQGNYLDFRENFFEGQSSPTGFGDSATITGMADGATDPSLDNIWAIIDNEKYEYIIQPYIDATNLTSIEGEMADRFLPLNGKQGHGYTAVRATQASATTLGNSRNGIHNTIMPAFDSPTAPEEWAAVKGAIAAFNLNNDPGRPLQFLKMKGIVAPPSASRFTQDERNILLFDGMSTYIVDSGGNVLIERLITTYQNNALGIPDPSYLDVNTLAILNELRFQYKTRMLNRFIIPRFKLADDSFPVQPGTFVVTPNVVRQEIIALFTELRDQGLIENLEDFKTNLVVERDAADRNRVNVLLPPDLINQFRILAGLLQFIL